VISKQQAEMLSLIFFFNKEVNVQKVPIYYYKPKHDTITFIETIHFFAVTIHWAEIRQLPVLAVDLAVATQVSFIILRFKKNYLYYDRLLKFIIYVILLPGGQ
jgi:hypothetical protein